MSNKIKLTKYELEMLAGKHGIPRRWAMEQQMRVAGFFDAEDFVEVSQAHIMRDTESLGEAGIEQFEKVDVVVFAAPQLSLFEIQHIVSIINGRQISNSTALLIATSPEIKSACDRFGITAELEDSGATSGSSKSSIVSSKSSGPPLRKLSK